MCSHCFGLQLAMNFKKFSMLGKKGINLSDAAKFFSSCVHFGSQSNKTSVPEKPNEKPPENNPKKLHANLLAKSAEEYATLEEQIDDIMQNLNKTSGLRLASHLLHKTLKGIYSFQPSEKLKNLPPVYEQQIIEQVIFLIIL